MNETAGRFEMRGDLGVGGMGNVYRVLDRARGKDVALKALRSLGGAELYRFKREFRVLADLEHPNLVRLHDLYEVGGEWMYTMELIEGVPFDQWVQDPARLRDALYQLADALAALHVAGKMHRDLKPSNVLVEPTGRVVLLDFGLATDVVTREVEATHDEIAVGTPAYMAPEQAADRPLTAACDWYAVGVMLYQALARGRRPFEGPSSIIMHLKQRQAPPPPSTFAPDAPEDLVRLCMGLLERDPAKRAGAAHVFATLERRRSVATERIANGSIRAPLVGRDDEMAAIKKALSDSRDHLVLVLLTGPTGSGKSALIHSFIERSRRAGAIALPGRAVEREVIPLRSLDPVVDCVSSYLMRMPAEDLQRVMPADMDLLIELFPVLRRVPGLAKPRLSSEPAAGAEDQLYRASFALAQLLDELARTRPVVVAIDDLQWGEEREAALIHRYEGPHAPHILLLLAIRDDSPDAEKMLRHYLAFQGDLRRIRL